MRAGIFKGTSAVWFQLKLHRTGHPPHPATIVLQLQNVQRGFQPLLAQTPELTSPLAVIIPSFALSGGEWDQEEIQLWLAEVLF